MKNTTAAQDRAVDSAASHVTEVVDELLAIIDDLDNQLTEAKEEADRLFSDISDLEKQLKNAQNQSSA